MMHPKTEVRFVDPTIGYGVFAAEDIPRGTIVYVRDRLEAAYVARSSNRIGADGRPGKTAYADESGVHIVSRDNARYVNHRCDCNVMATGYGFEIVVRDIWKGQEICEEYGLIDLGRDIPLSCGCTRCRKQLRPDDLERFHAVWDGLVLDALTRVADVHQPLMAFMDDETKHRLRAYLCGEEPYLSVTALARRAPGVLTAIPPDNPKPAPFGFNG